MDLEDKRGTFRLAGKRYRYHASVVNAPSSPLVGRWQINVHSDSAMPDTFCVADTFEAVVAQAKENLRS